MSRIMPSDPAVLSFAKQHVAIGIVWESRYRQELPPESNKNIVNNHRYYNKNDKQSENSNNTSNMVILITALAIVVTILLSTQPEAGAASNWTPPRSGKP